MQLKYTGPDYVLDVIARLGRTEDVKFSPSNHRLAVACFSKNQIAIFELTIADSAYGRKLTITDAAEISSASLKRPHGVDFLGEERIIVANRGGDATIFELPRGKWGGNCYELAPIGVVPSGGVMNTPGAVSVTRRDQDLYEVLICNNYSNRVTRHLIDFSDDSSFLKNPTVLLEKWLRFPDGVSSSSGWIAISNHDRSNVMLYDNDVPLNECSDPDGFLRYVYYPHGVRFTSDGRFILVADAGTPYVHIYSKDDSGWRGVRSPFKSLRVMSDGDFLRGPHNDDGGPKGIDLDCSMSTLVATFEVLPLAFFDLAGILEGTSLPQSGRSPEQVALQLKYELNRQDDVERAVAALTNRRSWRITAPLRWGLSLLHGHVTLNRLR